MKSVRYIMLGGFLGAGKTTTIARLARTYREQGLNVGIVTNDQADGLVDTSSLRAQGFDVGEVAGACFCCNFNELISTVRDLKADERPDVILAEPVGSCTDLVATVIQPLKQLYPDEFTLGPYAVLLKPSHGRRILSGERSRRSGFSPKAEYILRKQLEEADLIVINRIDELTAAEQDEITSLIESNLPERPQIRMSAKTGEGFAQLTESLDATGDFGRYILDIDYDIYAEGEAELGWLNLTTRASSDVDFPMDDLLTQTLTRIQQRLQESDFEIAHLKAIGLWEGFFGVANAVSNEDTVDLSLPSGCQVRQCDLVVNARVACSPEDLDRIVRNSVGGQAEAMKIHAEFREAQAFRPGRPVPTHRLAATD